MGRKITYKETVDSTNQVAFRLALGGEPEGSAVVAESQNMGKGRLGRVWFSPYGKNLCLSVILRPQVHPSRIYPITFLSSLAVYDTVRALGAEPTLKWPNDVLIKGKKSMRHPHRALHGSGDGKVCSGGHRAQYQRETRGAVGRDKGEGDIPLQWRQKRYLKDRRCVVCYSPILKNIIEVFKEKSESEI